MIDLHSHILPGLDDGPINIEGSMILIDFLYLQGFKTICATPHYKPYVYKYNEPQYLEAYENLCDAVNKKYPELKIILSHEVALSEINQHNTLKWRGLGESGYVLLEPPFDRFDETTLYNAIEKIAAMGLKTIIAHPARLSEFHENKNIDKQLNKMGVKYQVNLGSFSNQYGHYVKKLARSFLKNQRIIGFGSDLHHPKHFKSIAKGLQWIKKNTDTNGYNEIIF